MKKILVFLFLISILSCTSKQELGTEQNPIHFALVPGQDAAVLLENGLILEKWIRSQTGLTVKVQVPSNFVAVIEGLGSQRVDFAIINTFGYILAHDKYQANAVLIGENNGRSEYRGQIIAKDPKIKSVKDINGKKFAYVDPASTSGYVLPAKLLKDAQVKPKDIVFAGKHDSVVSMVYQGQVDAGATYHTPPEDGKPQDARKLVATQYPDVFDKVRIIAMTGSIPSDPVVFRAGFPLELQMKLVQALKSFSEAPDGKQTLRKLYHITNFKDCTDQTFDPVRKILLDLGKNAQDLIK
ncbi:phosphate/phosphite/phosphonate ABC transporter substrate-binding protein [Bdellovibrio sp. SKB1291214]|uniref:phosphate/phosphite/phosphonate ABC transporter substrate-binding protein n=1 Tax=Bdellovibrio sp. SKB1291214 TaxID=1732569 RepID=UPI000B516901|nr:phosphate/phosphite/phosphonate ABC transporter substrate-binding protein [Bdellovibrio sp. SKB1291214]UYL10311.1 phosphate/phosphite/phosphonate ABC transporter substrate-binding protein [Bdellovibrio sp. SKB1291214]